MIKLVSPHGLPVNVFGICAHSQHSVPVQQLVYCVVLLAEHFITNFNAQQIACRQRHWHSVEYADEAGSHLSKEAGADERSTYLALDSQLISAHS